MLIKSKYVQGQFVNVCVSSVNGHSFCVISVCISSVCQFSQLQYNLGQFSLWQFSVVVCHCFDIPFCFSTSNIVTTVRTMGSDNSDLLNDLV